MLRRTLSLSKGMAYCCLTPFSCLRELYISHKSTYGQRYLPSPPDPLSRTAGEGVNAPRSVLSRILPRWYANDRLLLPTRLLANA